MEKRRKERKGIDWCEDSESAKSAKKFTLRFSGDYERFIFEEGFLPEEVFDDFERAKRRADEVFESNNSVSSVVVVVGNGFVVYGRTMGSFGSCGG